MKVGIKILITIITVCVVYSDTIGQCVSPSNIYTFMYDGRTYEVIRENKTWRDAAACAVERGGCLVEINDSLEQNTVFAELNTNAGITTSNTIAPDGGNSSYVWIGGNDLLVEGNWVWDGNNDSISTQFWLGTSSGNSVGGLYNNWGNEPDNWGTGGQDGLGLALTNWPLGIAGQWNDVNHTNTLYFVVEYATALSLNDINADKSAIKVYPNPFKNIITIENNNLDIKRVVVINSIGQELVSSSIDGVYTQSLDMSKLESGIYFLRIELLSGKTLVQKIVK